MKPPSFQVFIHAIKAYTVVYLVYIYIYVGYSMYYCQKITVIIASFISPVSLSYI